MNRQSLWHMVCVKMIWFYYFRNISYHHASVCHISLVTILWNSTCFYSFSENHSMADTSPFSRFNNTHQIGSVTFIEPQFRKYKSLLTLKRMIYETFSITLYSFSKMIARKPNIILNVIYNMINENVIWFQNKHDLMTFYQWKRDEISSWIT